MSNRQRLLERLDTIGATMKTSGTALAVLGLGSVGVETERIDDYSDLDFFVIVKPGFKARYLDSLDWLASVAPIAYSFQNTLDGYKALFEDGIYCEFAIFEPDELLSIPFAKGRFIWKDDSFDENLCVPRPSEPSEHTLEWRLGEALTNLYVGLGRVHRGETLTGTRFIQSYAVDNILGLAPLLETAQGHARDQFASERRFEIRYPQTAKLLPTFIQGYDHNFESALAILNFLEQHFELPLALTQAIRRLCASR